MFFANPAFLWALFALAIPVIIHLFNFRKYVKVFFPNIRFLKEAKQETRSRNRLKHLLILCCRILALAFLIFAFAQPIIPHNNKAEKSARKLVSIWVDNSFSMNSEGKEGLLIEEARLKAIEIVKAYQPTDRFQLITNDFKGASQKLISKEEVLERINEITLSPNARSIDEVYKQQKEALLSDASTTEKHYYLISDFQKSTTKLTEAKLDTNHSFFFIPLQSSQVSNLYIDSCWFESPIHNVFQTEILNVRIVNKGEKQFDNIPVKLFINGKQKALASFSINAFSETEVALTYTVAEPGIQAGYVEITDYPITFDDRFYFGYNITGKYSILNIYENKENPYIKALFGKDSTLVYTALPTEKIDYASLSSYSLIIFSGLNTIPSGLTAELYKYISSGGTLVVFPGDKINNDSYNEFCKSLNLPLLTAKDTTRLKVSYFNPSHPLFHNIFEKIPDNLELPTAFVHYIFEKNSRLSYESLMNLQNGNPFLINASLKSGSVFLFSSTCDEKSSNFGKQALFVPTLHRIMLTSRRTNEIYQIINGNNIFEVPNTTITGDNVFTLKKADSDFSIIPEHRVNEGSVSILPGNAVQEAGNYLLYKGNDPIAVLSLNYNRKESQPECYTPDDIIKHTKNLTTKSQILDKPRSLLGKAISELNEGTKLWKIMLLLALLFLAAEAAIIRFWKN